MTSFFRRGGAWVLVQFMMLGAVILLGMFFRGAGLHPVIVIAGALLMLMGGGVFVAGVSTLGRSLTPLPKPREQARLVRHGIYAVIRHPLYTSAILCAVGWAMLWQSWPALLAAAALMPFFGAKAAREERWLREKYPEYAEYEQGVGRFIP